MSDIYEALTSAIYLARRGLDGLTDDEERIRASGLYRDWTLGSYQVGDIRNAGGQTWECYAAHDTTTYPDIQPGESAWYTSWPHTQDRPALGGSPGGP